MLENFRKNAGKIAKAAAFASALSGAHEAGAQIAPREKESPKAAAEAAAKERIALENVPAFLSDTVEPFIERLRAAEGVYDYKGLFDSEYALGREPVQILPTENQEDSNYGDARFCKQQMDTAERFEAVLIYAVHGKEKELPPEVFRKLKRDMRLLGKISKWFENEYFRLIDEKEILDQKKATALRESIQGTSE
ncbi:MAG: hypothetical protein V4674_03680 [Patescibacteria group bacterium]